MRLRSILPFALVIGLLGCSSKEPQFAGFEQAKERADERRQPLLLEFTKAGSSDCEQAIAAFDTATNIQGSLTTLSFYRVDVESEEGAYLGETYGISLWLPTYVLTDSKGKEIYRWSGFIAPAAFMRQLSRGTRDLTTVEAKIERFESEPSFEDAYSLANYFMSVKNPARAAEYYKQADRLNSNPRRDVKFEVFHAIANAVWYGQLDFGEAEKAADSVLASGFRTTINSVRVVQQLAPLSRRTGHTDRLVKYLQLAVERMSQPKDDNSRKIYEGLQAELQLYADHDTTRAIETKRASYGPAYSRKPTDDVDFSEWCADRGINLDEAELIAQRVAQTRPPSGRSYSDLYRILAKVSLARGDNQRAVTLAEQALEADPDNPLRMEFLKECQDKL